MKVYSLSFLQLFAIPWTVACQASLSMEFFQARITEGWGLHVTPWLIHVNVWQNPLKCCEVISLQLIKINEEKKNNRVGSHSLLQVTLPT